MPVNNSKSFMQNRKFRVFTKHAVSLWKPTCSNRLPLHLDWDLRSIRNLKLFRNTFYLL